MFCPNCGKEIEDGAKFCGECGADLAEEQTAEVAAEAAGSAAHQSADAVEFSFEKGKMIGNIVYRRTVTEATVSGDRIAISQSVKKIFRKERTETWESDSVCRIKDFVRHLGSHICDNIRRFGIRQPAFLPFYSAVSVYRLYQVGDNKMR